MKTASSLNSHSSRLGRQGSVLMVTLFVASLFGMFLFSYLYLVRNQKVLVTRSQAWNASMAAAEAGIEEGLAQLDPGVTQSNIDLTSNGWGSPSGGLYGP